MGGILSGPRPPPDLALCAEATVCPDNPAPAAGAGGAGGGRQPCDSCQSCGRKSWHPTLGPRSRLAQPEAGGGRRPTARGKVGTHVLLLVPKAALQAQVTPGRMREQTPSLWDPVGAAVGGDGGAWCIAGATGPPSPQGLELSAGELASVWPTSHDAGGDHVSPHVTVRRCAQRRPCWLPGRSRAGFPRAGARRGVLGMGRGSGGQGAAVVTATLGSRRSLWG